MAKESALTERVKNSIQIEDFIFHIIIKGEDEPRTVNRVVLEPAQRDFFCERIADASQGTQYKFREKDMGTALRCRRIIDDPQENFYEESVRLAVDFHEQHKGNVNDGAFIVARFSVEVDGGRVPMVAMLKMDHSRVLEYTIRNEGGQRVATMNEILNSFVEDRAALQKCAIIDVGETFDWDVLAFERNRPTGIADYFRVFLKAVESDNASNLTRRAVSAVVTWARTVRDDLPEVQRMYRERAVQYMEIYDHFDSDQFIDAVVRDEDKERKERLTALLRQQLEEVGVAGQRFAPAPGSIPDKTKRNKLTTAEGVSITWSGTQQAANVEIMDRDENGMYTIQVRTQHYQDA